MLYETHSQCYIPIDKYMGKVKLTPPQNKQTNNNNKNSRCKRRNNYEGFRNKVFLKSQESTCVGSRTSASVVQGVESGCLLIVYAPSLPVPEREAEVAKC